MVWWLAPSPQSRKAPGSNLSWFLLCGVCMLPPCMWGFSLGTPASSHCPKTCMSSRLVILNRPLEWVGLFVRNFVQCYTTNPLHLTKALVLTAVTNISSPPSLQIQRWYRSITITLTSSISTRGFSVLVFFRHWIIFPGMAPTYVLLVIHKWH